MDEHPLGLIPHQGPIHLDWHQKWPETSSLWDLNYEVGDGLLWRAKAAPVNTMKVEGIALSWSSGESTLHRSPGIEIQKETEEGSQSCLQQLCFD